MTYIGIDFGTSGARAIAIDEQENILVEVQFPFANSQRENLAELWQQGLFNLIAQIPQEIRQEIKAIAVNGTSSTVLLCNNQGQPVTTPILYNDARGVEVLKELQTIAPANHVVNSVTSSLAKLLWLKKQTVFPQGKYFLHQADWLSFLLHGKLGISDYHNTLKLGYDVEKLAYPPWLEDLAIASLLPQVLPPGTIIGEISKAVAANYHLPKNCVVCTGTTDSIAAFLASGANQPGEAVTSLGSTLVLKLLSQTPIEASPYGIYSHRLGNMWLTGGASNTGGAVLQHFFTTKELVELSQKINLQQPTNLDYYPLINPGDRFPINNPNLPPKLTPRPANQVEFLHGLLEGMAKIEAKGYQLLQSLGANPLKHIYTAGGGAKNPTWQNLRQRHLKAPILLSPHTEAAFGTALLAKAGNK
ncbi:MAG: FGGY-family carbohydrate kinase [Spirulinaceae cyanobacterium]